MRSSLVVIAAAAAAAAAAATAGSARADERHTTISAGLVLGARSSDRVVVDGPAGEAEGFGGPRLTLSWDPPPLPYPARPGYAIDAGLVPELIAGAYLDDQQGEGMLGVGLRGELRVAQKEQGLFRVSVRAVFYVAARALVVGEQRDVLGELVLGEYLLAGRAARFGFEIGGVTRRADGADPARNGITGQLYLGWRL